MGLFSFIGRALKKVFSIIQPLIDWLTPDVPDRQGLTISRDGSNLAIPVVYGRQKVGAIKVHKYVTNRSGGVTNEFLHIICVLSEGEIESVDELFFNDISENDSRFSKKNGDKWFTKSIHLGGEDQFADAVAAVAIPNWTTRHRLRGLAYVYLRLEIDSDQTVWRGEPSVTAIIKGKKILDTRTNVVAYSNNPAMCTRDYIVNGIYGKGLPSARINDSLFNTAADFCDQTTSVTRVISRSFYDAELGEYVNLPATTETVQIKRFTCNIVIDTDRTVFENTQELLGTFRGILPPTYNTGPTVEDQGSPLVDINADDIVGSISVDTGTINDRKNRIVVRFPSELADFEYDEAFYPRDTDSIRATWLEEDGGVNLEGVYTFNGISNKAEALQAAEIIAKRSRFNTVVNITLQPEFIIYDVANIVSITDETHGWIAKPFRITRKIISEDGLIKVTLAEHEDSIYPWSGRTYEDRQGGTNLGNPEVVDAPLNLSFLPDTTLTTAGALTWEYATNAFVRRFNVVITKTVTAEEEEIDPPIVITDVDVFDKSYIVPTLDAGTYNFSVFAISTIGIRSAAAVFLGLLDSPAAPTSITINPSNFELEILPQLAGIGIGTEFEFALTDTNTVLARGSSVRFVGLVPNTLYTVFARSVNAYGTSIWVSATATTTNNAQPIIDLIGEDIAGVILPTVLAELEDDFQAIVDMSLVDYPTTIEVNTLIDDSISLVNDAVGEDIRISVVDGVIDVFVDFENQEDIRTESIQRITETDRLTAETADNSSQIAQTNQVLTDETSARTTQINQLTAVVDTDRANNAAELVEVRRAAADETSARVTQITQLSATVSTDRANNSAQFVTVNQAIADETSARATQINQLTATVNTNENSTQAQFITVNQAIADETSARTTSVSQLSATVNDNTASITSNSQAISDEAGTRASEVLILEAADSAQVSRISSVETLSNDNATAINAVEGTVNNPTSGLSATFSLAQSASTTAGQNTNSITSIQNAVDDPTSGLSATFTLAGGASTTADGAASAIAGLNTAIAGSDNQSQAELLLSSAFVPELGASFSRAFLGVTNTTGGVSTINGILVDGATNSLDFRADTFRLTDTSGNVRLAYSTVDDNWAFSGNMTAGTIGIGDNFAVTNAGDLTASGAVFTGLTVNSTSSLGAFINASMPGIGLVINNSAGRALVSTGFTGVVGVSNGGEGRGVEGRGSVFDFYAAGSGTNYGPFTGAHDGLIQKEVDKIEVGDIVCDDKLIHISNVSNAIFSMRVSSKPNDKKSRGVLVSRSPLVPTDMPASLEGDDWAWLSLNNDRVIFNSVGEGAMNVCGENGDIEAGDLIVTSSIKGKGMKQDDDIVRSITVAESRQDVTFSSKTQVKQIAVIYKCG